MRRFLIALTLLLLLIVSVCAGIAIANWPHWACRRHWACGWQAACNWHLAYCGRTIPQTARRRDGSSRCGAQERV